MSLNTGCDTVNGQPRTQGAFLIKKNMCFNPVTYLQISCILDERAMVLRSCSICNWSVCMPWISPFSLLEIKAAGYEAGQWPWECHLEARKFYFDHRCRKEVIRDRLLEMLRIESYWITNIQS